MPGKRRSETERMIIFRAAMNGLDLKAVNVKLNAAGYRSVPYASYHMVCHRYVPAFKKKPGLIDECIEHPVPVKDLP